MEKRERIEVYNRDDAWKKAHDGLLKNWRLRQQLDDYQLLTEQEKLIVAELGLTPETPDAGPSPEDPFEQEERQIGVKFGLIPPDEDNNLPLEKKRRQMKADVLADYFSRGDNSGEIYVWLDNMNYGPEKNGFYYVRYHNSILAYHGRGAIPLLMRILSWLSRKANCARIRWSIWNGNAGKRSKMRKESGIIDSFQ